jgi:hypothetical protein
MGKIVTIYLSDRESSELKAFCDENQCTQYSALKTAVRVLLSRSPTTLEETHSTKPADDIPEEDYEEDEFIDEKKQNNDSTNSNSRALTYI